MKYYRCPHCGEPGISALYKNTFAKTHYNLLNIKFEDLLRNDNGEVCKYCKKMYVIRPRYNSTHYVLAYVGMMIFNIAILIANLYFAKNSHYLSYYLTPVILAPFFGTYWIPKLMCAPLPADKKTMKKIDIMSNVSVELLEIAKNIHNYDIHAIKFDAKTYNIRFKEVFNKEQVPIMFLKRTRAQISPIEAYIIKKEFVPEDLLFEGSTFSIIDTKGTVIGKGKIRKILQ